MLLDSDLIFYNYTQVAEETGTGEPAAGGDVRNDQGDFENNLNQSATEDNNMKSPFLGDEGS